MLKMKRVASDRRKIKILLLGQSESGKSTIVKQLQIYHSPSAFDAVRFAWKAVIYLNLIQSIRRILIILSSDTLLKRVAKYGYYIQQLEPLTALEEQLQTFVSSRIDVYSTLVQANRLLEDSAGFAHSLKQYAPAMSELWNDPNVRKKLQKRRVRMEESGGFFLNDITRITDHEFVPTNADILKACVKTKHVTELTFFIRSGVKSNDLVEWRVLELVGDRRQRKDWARYFQDVNTLIFFAPLSAFDQVSAEDPHVNMLQDILSLWKEVVGNKLLANVDSIILFLTKCDLLKAKLEDGVKLNRHAPSYGDLPNDYNHVLKYLRDKFSEIRRSHSVNRKHNYYVYPTSMIYDEGIVKNIITCVRDSVLRQNLRSTPFL